MVLISKTGLLESVKHPVRRHVRAETVHFPVVAGPAPYALRPFAGVYNPFPYGCSILCNHPADFEAKDVVRRAKDTWASEGRALAYGDGEAAVPEELFRRYTDTDSRPATPAPTLASAGARGSGRRCVTPDAATSATASASAGSASARGRGVGGGARTLLVLDLRRSRSQGALPLPPSPPTPPPRAPGSLSSASAPTSRCSKASSRKRPGPPPPHNTAPPPASEAAPLHKLQLPPINKSQPTADSSTVLTDTTAGSGDEDLPRRRGKRRKRGKKGRDGSREPEKEFQGLPEPGETQVSALPLDSRAASARPSFSGADPASPAPSPTAAAAPTPANSMASAPPPSTTPATPPPPAHVSYLDAAVLKHLQRELDHEVVDSEFQPKKHRALEEALKARPHEKRRAGEEMRRLKRELRLPPSDTDLWLTLPRVFSRQSSRFELPLDSRTLNKMSPLQYLQSYVAVSSGRKLLYNMVFNRHREELEDEDTDRRMKAEYIITGLEEVMGAPLSEEQIEYFRSLVGWKDTDKLDFRTWCGICAACERLLGPQFASQVASKEDDPCHEVEKADFETLPRKLQGLNPDPRLLTILNGIREL